MKKLHLFIVVIVLFGLNEAIGQWNTSGNDIYNTNSGNVGIGNSTPATLLHVGKLMTEPTITVQNLGGSGGATYTMMDQVSGANWKFKATNTGGFKIRDHASLMDVIIIEPNSFANAIYIKTADNIGIGTATPHSSAAMDITSTTKGFLLPRMTYAEINSISNPADGLLVYCTDCGQNGLGTLSMFMAGVWYTLSANCMTPVSPVEGTHVPSETQIIWNWNIVAGATGYKWNTTNDYATAEDMSTSTSKTETGLTSNTAFIRFAWAYNACGNSPATTLNATTSGGGACGGSLIINHVAGDVAPVDKTVTYGTVTGIPGESTKCWITSNLGADHQASAVNDATEASAGWYWQFNRMQGYKHDGTTRTPNATWEQPVVENSDWLAANDPCTLELGSSWRLPTITEWTNVVAGGGWTNWNGPWGSALKMHAAGYLLSSNGSLLSRGAAGFFWSSSQYDSSTSWFLYFGNGYCSVEYDVKAYGFSVRCLRD